MRTQGGGVNNIRSVRVIKRLYIIIIINRVVRADNVIEKFALIVARRMVYSG